MNKGEALLYQDFAGDIERFRGAESVCKINPNREAIKAMFDSLFLLRMGIRKYVEEGMITQEEADHFLDEIRAE